MEMGAKLVVETLDGLAENSIQEKPQPQVENPKNAFKIFKENTRINWQKSSEMVYNFIRGMSPYPAAFTSIKIGDDEKVLKIFKGHFEENSHNQKPGALEIDKNHLQFYTENGIYYPEEVQLEGKKRMSVKDFINGFQDFKHISAAFI